MGMLDRKPLLMGNCFTSSNRAGVGEVGNFLTKKNKDGGTRLEGNGNWKGDAFK